MSDDARGAGRLPREIKVRLADMPRHYEALALQLERTPRKEFEQAARAADAEGLARSVYPIERAFEILTNYVAELAELGLREAGIVPADRPTNLRLLCREGVFSSERGRRLRGILGARNDLQHEYPDVRAAGIYEEAASLVQELPGFLRDYVAWMRKLGFGGDDERR